MYHTIKLMYIFLPFTLREKCPNTEFFWSLFARIRTEYGKIWTRKNSVFGHSLRSVKSMAYENGEGITFCAGCYYSFRTLLTRGIF